LKPGVEGYLEHAIEHHSASENPIGIETYARRGGRSVEDHHRNASGATVVFCVAI